MTRTSSKPSYARTTVGVTGTVRTAPCHLSHEASMAVAYATAWHQRAGHLKVPTSGLIRRALVLYVRHLETLGQERQRGEFHAVRTASEATSPPREDHQQMAALRLHAVPLEEPPAEVR